MGYKVLGRTASLKADDKRNAKKKTMLARKKASLKEENARKTQQSGSSLGKKGKYNTKTKKWSM